MYIYIFICIYRNLFFRLPLFFRESRHLLCSQHAPPDETVPRQALLTPDEPGDFQVVLT